MTGNIPFSYKGKTGKSTVIEYVEYDRDKIPESYFSKSTARVSDKIDNEKDCFLPLSKFVEFIETIGEDLIVGIWRVI